MTPEQAYKLRKGDRILVEMVVDGNTADPFVSAYLPSLRAIKTFIVDPYDIREVLPRPLKAGDRVKGKMADSFLGQVIAVDGDVGWVRWADGYQGLHPFSDLQRVEEDQ